MNRILTLLIRLLFRERAEMRPDDDKKTSLYKKVMKKCEEKSK